MKNIDNIVLPDDVYDLIARRAQAAGRSAAEEIAEVVKRDTAAEARESALIEDIKRGHDEQAKAGIFLTTEELVSAPDWGRE
ncbi:MAG: hypothetical protein ACAI43_26580 [Phycisphaerae bacterium]